VQLPGLTGSAPHGGRNSHKLPGHDKSTQPALLQLVQSLPRPGGGGGEVEGGGGGSVKDGRSGGGEGGSCDQQLQIQVHVHGCLDSMPSTHTWRVWLPPHYVSSL
jgi:hypothetical protein